MTPTQPPPGEPNQPGDPQPDERRPGSQPPPGKTRRRRSAEGSAGSSTGSSAAEFLADPGPTFDEKNAPAAPPPDAVEEVAAALEEWDEPRIREILTLQGEVTHELLRVGKDDTETWIHTEKDLRAIAPPLTRILNRYDATRALAAAGDEALLAAAVVRYGARNFTKRRRLLAARAAEAAETPITGVEAPPDTGAEADEEWQRVVGAPPALTPKGVHHR
jgi:hypothetical protein